MSAKHTPGPWTVGNEHGRNINMVFSPDTENAVAAIYGVPMHCSMENLDKDAVERHAEYLANAALIAAAPELLEALEALTSAFMSHTQWNGTPPNEILNARAAIKKARGSGGE